MDICIACSDAHVTHLKSNLKKNTIPYIHAIAQNFSIFPDKSFTANIKIKQLKDIGVKWVILGSDRITEKNDEIGVKTFLAF